MPRGHPMPELTLTTDERDTLERWARRPTTAQALAQRARMILACAEGRPNEHVARRECVTARPWADGALASSASGWTACSTSRAQVPRDRLPTSCRCRSLDGDVVVWGGPARLRYIGALPLEAGHHPVTGAHRINLTFRRAA